MTRRVRIATGSKSTCQRTFNRRPPHPGPLPPGERGRKEIMGRHVVLSLFLIVSTVGCATFSGAPHTVKTGCAYDQAWSVALASVDEFELREVNQAGGVIATEWRGFASQRKAGALQRQVNEERARFFLNVEVAPGRSESPCSKSGSSILPWARGRNPRGDAFLPSPKKNGV